MECPKCHHIQAGDLSECLKCGLIFAKYKPRQIAKDNNKPGIKKFFSLAQIANIIKELVVYIEPSPHPLFFIGRAFIYIILIIWAMIFIFTPMETNYVGECFIHLINLPFHEAGHIFFRPFGHFIMMLGGTLGQLLMPFICLVAFLIKGNSFGASVAFWWFGENFMDIAPYINDARALNLILLGGVTGKEVDNYHDWEYILGHLNLLYMDHIFANFSYYFGAFIMIAALFWGGYILIKQYKFVQFIPK